MELKQRKFNHLFFLHIPKAGGSTLHNILEKSYKGKSILTLKPDIVHPNGNTSLRYLNMVQKKIQQIDPDELNKYHLIKGHFYFGIHNKINSSYKYITIIRNPIERIISLYYFIKRRKNNAFYNLTNQISLYDFVKGNFEINNLQTKMLVGEKFHSFDENSLINIAQNNINNHFHLVGITERLDEFLILLNKELGIKLITYRIQNKSQNKPSIIDIDKRTKNLILKKNEIDYELYNYVKEKFLNRWTDLSPNLILKFYQTKNIILNKIIKNAYKEGF